MNNGNLKPICLALIAFLLILTNGCVVSDSQTYKSSLKDRAIIVRGTIENKTMVVLKEVQVFHLPTRAITSVSAIYPKTSAEIGFRPTQLRADVAVLSWIEKGNQMKVRLEVPQVAAAGHEGPLTLVYRIFPGSRVTVQLE